MNRHVETWLLLAAGMALTACGTGHALLEKNAQDAELQKETTAGVPLPPGCPTLITSSSAGQSGLTISYQEPKTSQAGKPLADLAYTTIYLTWPKAQTSAIRIWTNNAHGGALVTIHNIPVPAQELGLCVTATNSSGQESSPASPAQPKP
jgi:hypothetical protein